MTPNARLSVPPRPLPHRRGRAAFSLVELMVVIGIIALLAGLLLPAITNSQTSAEQLETQTELSRFDNALIAFQREYGQYPPSFFVINENPQKWYLSTSLTDEEKIRRDDSLRTIRALFGQQFDVSAIDPVDINGDGSVPSDVMTDGDTIYLNGAESLVFFLGGMMVDGPSGSRVPIGFSRDGTFPFSLTTTSNRTQPFEFDGSRFVDLDGDGMLEYLDAFTNQQTPYQYFSAYGGSGYRPAGFDGLINEREASPAADDIVDDETIVIGTGSDTQLIGPRFAYHKLDSGGTGASIDMDQPWNPDTYQILSPGQDGLYGLGGSFDPDQGLETPTGARDFGAVSDLGFNNLKVADKSLLTGSNLTRNPALERDNISNFSEGRMGN